MTAYNIVPKGNSSGTRTIPYPKGVVYQSIYLENLGRTDGHIDAASLTEFMKRKRTGSVQDRDWLRSGADIITKILTTPRRS